MNSSLNRNASGRETFTEGGRERERGRGRGSDTFTERERECRRQTEKAIGKRGKVNAHA